MPRPYSIPVWKKAPFIRILTPVVAGILLQWYLQIDLSFIAVSFISFSIAFALLRLLPMALRYKLHGLNGILIHLLLISFGAWLCWQNDMRHQPGWYGNHYRNTDHLLVSITEPLVEKNRSFKAEGNVEFVVRDKEIFPCKGKLLIYFSKDSNQTQPGYGDRIMIHQGLQAIRNSGNPGAFNYERYAAFQGIFHNVFLKEKDWVKLNGDGKTKNLFRQFIFDTREKILDILRRHVSSGNPDSYRDQLGIAEALLIGYTNDLDKDLVQAYSNTGVVHIIAISGMHLGLIYVLLTWIFVRLPLIRRSKTTQVILILGCLWLFSLLTGASASVLRSAVMFTFITVGKNFSKRSSIYNSLAASAFVMLCFNPYYLWDVGFQLSYLAIVGIIVFQKPVYNIVHIKNKWLDKIWQLAAVSFAAQMLTFPICIYYFHQFPNLFLISNIIAVPLSGVILYAEIGLLALAWIPFVGEWLGRSVSWMVWIMNRLIIWVNELPFAVWDKIPAAVLSTILLYAVVIALSTWFLQKNKKWLLYGMIFLLSLTIWRAWNKWETIKQRKIIVYNVPRYQAIDLVEGDQYQFIGDSALREKGLLQNFHIKPGRIFYQLGNETGPLRNVFRQDLFYQFGNKRIMIVDKAVNFETASPKMEVDLVIISKNPALDISWLNKVFHCKQIIFDASNPEWKIDIWEKECRALLLPTHSVSRDGAFVSDIGI